MYYDLAGLDCSARRQLKLLCPEYLLCDHRLPALQLWTGSRLQHRRQTRAGSERRRVAATSELEPACKQTRCRRHAHQARQEPDPPRKGAVPRRASLPTSLRKRRGCRADREGKAARDGRCALLRYRVSGFASCVAAKSAVVILLLLIAEPLTRRERWEEHRRGLGVPVDEKASRGAEPPAYSPPSSALPYLPKGTVGAVALDKNGMLACATSTGGKTNKNGGWHGFSSLAKT